jgi:AraC-like DNA-binding protein
MLRDALDDAAEGAPADRVDHACEGLILESLLCRFPARTDGAAQAVETVRARIEAECAEGPDFDGLALEAGYSPSHLRRLWAEQVGPPPGRYAEEVRMRRARRLLAETDLPVREIATRLGYEDPLYFSRVFRKVVGLPATAYRERHRNELTFGQLQ